jgi:hypothetical protein
VRATLRYDRSIPFRNSDEFLKRPGGCEREGQQIVSPGRTPHATRTQAFPELRPVDAHRRNFLVIATSTSAMRRLRRSMKSSTAARPWSPCIRPRPTAAAGWFREFLQDRSNTPPTPPARPTCAPLNGRMRSPCCRGSRPPDSRSNAAARRRRRSIYPQPSWLKSLPSFRSSGQPRRALVTDPTLVLGYSCTGDHEAKSGVEDVIPAALPDSRSSR